MTSIRTTILIEASAKRIWDILMNFEAYPKWNPFITSIQFKDPEQKSLKVLISPPGGNAMKFEPIIRKNIVNKEFAWEGKIIFKGIFDGYHSFQLEETKEGQTIFTHNENFSGILVPLFRNALKTNTLKGFELMNDALKARAEDKG